MKIIKPMVEILFPDTPKAAYTELKRIEEAGRTCYQSEKDIAPTRFVKNLIERKHESPLEHGFMSVRFTTDRGIANEIVRHRIASFSQESTRYCAYDKDKFNNEIQIVDFTGACEYDPYWSALDFKQGVEAIQEWSTALQEAEAHYMKLREMGVSPQIARGVLPLATKTSLIMTANLREWRHFLNLRAANTTGPAHPQMQELARMLLIEAENLFPAVFGDILEGIREKEQEPSQ